jgi:hypothetical protein
VTLVTMKANAEYDLVGTDDFRHFRDEMMQRYSIAEQERWRGVKIMRLPTSYATAPNTNPLTLPPASSGFGTLGPESGFVWRLGRVTVMSSGSDNAGFVTPASSQPAVPASTTPIQNPNPFPARVVISAGTVTAVAVNGVTVGTGDGTYIVPTGGSIAVTYSVAPTWVWSYAGVGTVLSPGAGYGLYTTSDETAQNRNAIDVSLQVGQSYTPGSRGVFLMPSEGLVAVISAPVTGNIYTMTGQFISVPAEMQGKIT